MLWCSRGLVVALFIPTIAPGQQSAKSPLRWDWEKLGKIWITTVLDSEQHLTLLNDEVATKRDREVSLHFVQTLVSTYRFAGKDDDGNYKIAQQIESLEIQSPQGTAAPDKKLARFEVTLYVDKNTGKLIKVDQQDYDNLIEKWLAGETRSVPSRTLLRLLSKKHLADRVGAIMGSTAVRIVPALSRKTFESIVGQMLEFLPPRDQDLSKPWGTGTITRNLGPMGSITLTRSYKHEGKGEKNKDKKKDKSHLEKISVTSQMDKHVPFKAAEDEVTLFQITESKLNGKGSGTIYFDAKTGRLAEASYEVNVSGAITITGDARKRQAKIKQKQTTTITVSDKPPEKKKKKDDEPGVP